MIRDKQIACPLGRRASTASRGVTMTQSKILLVSSFFFLILLFSPSYALFDTGTALDKGSFEADIAINPFKSITYGQNFVFMQYGLGNKYEAHGYLSKWGTIFDWENSTYEGYLGIIKQWADFKYVDLATSVGLRKVLDLLTLYGPGILYTIKINKYFRIAGHLNYVGDIISNNDTSTLTNYNNGYAAEIGFYLKLTQSAEFALGGFMNTTGLIRPIYTLNFYF